MTVKIDIKDYVTLSVTIPKVEKYGELFIFFGDGTFMDQLMYTAAGDGDLHIRYILSNLVSIRRRILPLIYRIWRTLLNQRLVRM